MRKKNMIDDSICLMFQFLAALFAAGFGAVFVLMIKFGIARFHAHDLDAPMSFLTATLASIPMLLSLIMFLMACQFKQNLRNH